MPTYDELLDAALLAVSVGKEAERKAVEALLAAYPDRPGGPALATLAALWTGELEEAQRLAAALGDRPPELAMRAEVASYVGDKDRAKTLLESALDTAPEDPIVMRSAYSILGLDDPARALEIARRRVEMRPHDPGAYASLGMAMIGAGRVEEAERLAAARGDFEGASVLWVLRSRLAMKRRDLPLAEAHAREAVALGSDSGQAWATLADVLRHQGKKEEAGRAAGFALELNRRNPMPMRVLSSLAAARGDREEAARWERQAEAAIPALAFIAGMRRANELARQGKPEAALEELGKLTGVPGHTGHTARTMRTTLLLDMDDDDALAAEVAAMEAEGIRDITLLRAQAEIDRRAGRLPEARERLETVWRADRPSSLVGPLLALRAATGDLDAARDLAVEATADVPGTPADAGAAFLALDKAGLKPEARAFLAAAQRRYPEAQMLELLRAGTLAEDGNLSGALHAMRGLDAQHRPRIRIRISLWKLLRALWRRSLRR